MERQIARTLAIVTQLANGQRLVIDNYTIAMAEDMTIGVLMHNETTGDETISGLTAMDLKQLNNILEKNSVGFAIPGYSGGLGWKKK